MCVLIMASGSDQSSELSVLDGGDDGSISPDSRHLAFGRINYRIRVFSIMYSAWTTQSHLKSFHISLYKIQILP